MEADVANGEEVTADFQAFLATIRKYTDITELTPTVLNEFISRIEVHAPDKSTGKRIQQVDVYYNAVGVIDIPTPEEMDILQAEYAAHKQQKSDTQNAKKAETGNNIQLPPFILYNVLKKVAKTLHFAYFVKYIKTAIKHRFIAVLIVPLQNATPVQHDQQTLHSDRFMQSEIPRPITRDDSARDRLRNRR